MGAEQWCVPSDFARSACRRLSAPAWGGGGGIGFPGFQLSQTKQLYVTSKVLEWRCPSHLSGNCDMPCGIRLSAKWLHRPASLRPAEGLPGCPHQRLARSLSHCSRNRCAAASAGGVDFVSLTADDVERVCLSPSGVLFGRVFPPVSGFCELLCSSPSRSDLRQFRGWLLRHILVLQASPPTLWLAISLPREAFKEKSVSMFFLLFVMIWVL